MTKININKANDIGATRATGRDAIKNAEKTRAKATDTRVEQDQLHFSSRVTEVGKLVDRIKKLPDVRENRVEVLRTQISEGRYNPADKEIADSLLRDEG